LHLNTLDLCWSLFHLLGNWLSAFSPRRLDKFHILSVGILDLEMRISSDFLLGVGIAYRNKNAARERYAPRGEVVVIAQITSAHYYGTT
jgi:hypothetical protein